MPILPTCPASEALRAEFPGAPDVAIIKYWVDKAVGEHDRSRCFGSTAVRRASSKLQVIHYEDDLMLHDGELRLSDGHRKVFIRGNQYPPRMRFTLAHELGHASLHILNPELEQSGPGVERLCNLFAAELLMPGEAVNAVWQKTPDVDSIVRLAALTDSSLSASCIRIAECLDSTTTGLASSNGVVIERYGGGIVKDLDAGLARACQEGVSGKFFLNLKNGLIVSTRTVRKRVAFLVMKSSRQGYRLLTLGLC